MKFNIENKNFVRAAPFAQMWVTRLVIVLGVYGMGEFVHPVYFFGFAAAFAGELLRFSIFALRFARQLTIRKARVEAEEEAKDLAAEQANKTELITASARQIDEVAITHGMASMLSHLFLTSLIERLRAAAGGIVHTSLSSRLLPTPFAAR